MENNSNIMQMRKYLMLQFLILFMLLPMSAQPVSGDTSTVIEIIEQPETDTVYTFVDGYAFFLDYKASIKRDDTKYAWNPINTNDKPSEWMAWFSSDCSLPEIQTWGISEKETTTVSWTDNGAIRFNLDSFLPYVPSQSKTTNNIDFTCYAVKGEFKAMKIGWLDIKYYADKRTSMIMVQVQNPDSDGFKTGAADPKDPPSSIPSDNNPLTNGVDEHYDACRTWSWFKYDYSSCSPYDYEANGFETTPPSGIEIDDSCRTMINFPENDKLTGKPKYEYSKCTALKEHPPADAVTEPPTGVKRTDNCRTWEWGYTEDGNKYDGYWEYSECDETDVKDGFLSSIPISPIPVIVGLMTITLISNKFGKRTKSNKMEEQY